MSVSCVGICTNCGIRRFWLSDTLSLQLDDGQLKCLPHPAERWACEKEGLTPGQASQRGRLYRETFYVCRNCGRYGETIEKRAAKDFEELTFSVRGAMKWGWGSAAIVVPLLVWMHWWQSAFVIGSTLAVSPGIYWWENRKLAKARGPQRFPTDDAPGSFPIAPPVTGCIPDTIVGWKISEQSADFRATGRCCDKPDWIVAACAKDEDRVPCCACGRGVMAVSEHSIH